MRPEVSLSRRATATSSRSPGRSAVSSSARSAVGVPLRLVALAEDEEADDDGEADGDRRVGHVELRIAGEVDEIGDLAEAQAVDEVAGGAAELQPQGKAQQAVLQRREGVVEEDGADGEDGRNGEEEPLTLEHAEGGARVRHVGDLDQPVVRGPGLAQGEAAADQGL